MLVTIVGVINSNLVQEGDRREVEWTPKLAKLQRNGVIRIVPPTFQEGGLVEGKGLLTRTTDEPEAVVTPVFVAAAAGALDAVQHLATPAPTEPLVVPGRNAKREDWVAFLTQENIVYDVSDTRDELIGRWEARDGAGDPGSPE